MPFIIIQSYDIYVLYTWRYDDIGDMNKEVKT